jgi:hypothetical protein
MKVAAASPVLYTSTSARDFLQQGRKFVSECVPKNFAYFHVEFGLSSGFIHVIDDEQEFPRTFGADVVAGVLEIPGEVIARLKRKPAQEVMDDAAAVALWRRCS